MIDLTPDNLKEVFGQKDGTIVHQPEIQILKAENKELKKQVKLLIEALKIKK